MSAISTRQRRAAAEAAYKRFAKQNLGEAGLCLAGQNQIRGSHWAGAQWERWRQFSMSCKADTSPYKHLIPTESEELRVEREDRREELWCPAEPDDLDRPPPAAHQLLSPNFYLFYAMGLKPTASKQAMASSVDRKSRKALAASGLALFFMTAAG